MALELTLEPGEADGAFQSRMNILISQAGGPSSLAQKSGLSRRVIDKYRSGESDPSRTRLVALARAGGVTIEWLATGNGSMAPDAPPLQSAQPPPVDEKMLELAITAVDRHLAERGLRVPPDKKAAIIAALYSIATEDGGAQPACTPRSIARLVRLAVGE